MTTEQLTRDVKRLKAIVLALTLLPGAALLCASGRPDKPVHFKEISVERLNLVERDGTLKMVLANKERFPQEIVSAGTTIPNKRDVPGMLFYNELGEECGGLIFGGKKDKDGKVSAGGHLSFDRFGQDQVIALTYQQQGPTYTAGLTLNDAPDAPIAETSALREKLKNASPAEQQQAQRDGKVGLLPRVYMGTTRSKSSALLLNDQQGSNRMMLLANTEQSTLDFKDNQGRLRLSIGVDAKNQPMLRFFDETGKEAKTVGL